MCGNASFVEQMKKYNGSVAVDIFKCTQLLPMSDYLEKSRDS